MPRWVWPMSADAALARLWRLRAATFLVVAATVWAALAVIPEMKTSAGFGHRVFFSAFEAGGAYVLYYLVWSRNRLAWRILVGLAGFHILSAFWAGPFPWWVESPAALLQLAVLCSAAVRNRLN